jgi:hypothetical protein
MKGIKLDTNNNFLVVRGDFVVDDTDHQDQSEIIYANKGNFLETSNLGVGITQFSNSPLNRPELEKIIRKEFEKDNINVVKIQLKNAVDDNFNLNVIAERNEEN